MSIDLAENHPSNTVDEVWMPNSGFYDSNPRSLQHFVLENLLCKSLQQVSVLRVRGKMEFLHIKSRHATIITYLWED